MIIAKNDEEKRSKVWRMVTMTATAVIIVVAGYFLFTLFAGNPLEGIWLCEDSNLELTIHGRGSATVSWPELSEASDVNVKVEYEIDKSEKTITFKVDDEGLSKAVKASDKALTEKALRAEIRALETTFDYSLEENTLVLAEREYGEQLVFVKK